MRDLLAITHQGLVRKKNEDRAVAKQFEDGSILLAVADGLGGHAAGDQAAQIAADTVSEYKADADPNSAGLIDLIQTAQDRIKKESATELQHFGMGTTLTACTIREGRARWVHVGDTRLYLFRNDLLKRITDDHTIPGVLLKRGEIQYEQARLHPMRNMLMKCLGCADYQADMGEFDLAPNDLLMISSDGLHDLIAEEAILTALKTHNNLKDKLDALVQAALSAGGTDNITVAAAIV